jgi:hypothetical protein
MCAHSVFQRSHKKHTKKKTENSRTRLELVNHSLTWGVTLLLTLGLFLTGSFGPTDVQCWLLSSWKRYVFWYDVVLAVFLVSASLLLGHHRTSLSFFWYLPLCCWDSTEHCDSFLSADPAC